MWKVLTLRPIAACALLIVAAAATGAMLEPVIPLMFESRLGLGPAEIGTLFGIAAIASSAMHPIYGRLSDRWGGRRLMMAGLVGFALMLPVMNLATDFRSAAMVIVPTWMVFGMVITPSLAYFAEIASDAGVKAYGVVYGVYNVAWAVGLMAGPAVGGFFLERAGFGRLTVGWSALLLATTLVLAKLR
jgi:DHA1 family solute carrier family 18 vesicular amine transporter 1/2